MTSRFIKTFLFTIIILCTLCVAKNKDASECWHSWRKAQEKYPLACWAYFQRFPGTYEEYKTYADCNFTFVSIPTEINHYDNAVKAGLKVLIGGWQYLHEKPDTLAKLLSFPSENDQNVIGYQMKDEPEPPLFPDLAKAHEQIYARDKRTVLPITDLLPDYAWVKHSRRAERYEMNYDEMVAYFIDTVRPPVILNCHYAPLLDGSDRPSFYANNELMRKNALRNDIGFMAFISAAAYSDIYRVPSESDFRWQVSTCLAYGAQGIWYWNWRIKPAGVFHEGLVHYETGEPTESYHHVKKVNAEVLAIGDVLMQLRSRNIWHTGDDVPAGTTKFPNMPELGGSVIDHFEGDNFIVSEFDNQDDLSDRDTYVMIVNKRHDADLVSAAPSLAAEALFKPAAHYGCIYLYQPESGKPVELEPEIYNGKNGYFRLPFEGGQARLLRFSRAKPGVVRTNISERRRLEFARNIPEVDGRLEDVIWKKSSELDMSVPGGNSKPIEPAIAKAAWRDHQLWFCLDMADSDIIARGDKNGQDHYKLGDCVEIFIKPEFSDWYWEIWINPRGNYTTLFWDKKNTKALKLASHIRLR
jgi:hypothetical protein